MKIADLLSKAQILHLRTEMEIFLSHLLKCDRLDLIAKSESALPISLLGDLHQGWLKIQDSYPVAYLTNSKEFYGRDFYVDQRVLIPRDTSEYFIDFLKEKASFGAELLEIGTGSGALSISLKLERSDLILSATDIDLNALDVAKMNAEKYGAEINFIHSDLLESVPEKNFEILFANLPYIGEEKHRFIDENVEKHEPKSALFGGTDGLRLYAKLFEQAKKYKFKTIIIEIGFSQGLDAEDLSREILPEYDFKLLQDSEGLDRFVLLSPL